MVARMRHRGPDSSGSWVAPSGLCALGHARLAVIDLETGGQPILNETGTVGTVVNGMFLLRNLTEAVKPHRYA